MSPSKLKFLFSKQVQNLWHSIEFSACFGGFWWLCPTPYPGLPAGDGTPSFVPSETNSWLRPCSRGVDEKDTCCVVGSADSPVYWPGVPGRLRRVPSCQRHWRPEPAEGRGLPGGTEPATDLWRGAVTFLQQRETERGQSKLSNDVYLVPADTLH